MSCKIKVIYVPLLVIERLGFLQEFKTDKDKPHNISNFNEDTCLALTQQPGEVMDNETRLVLMTRPVSLYFGLVGLNLYKDISTVTFVVRVISKRESVQATWYGPRFTAQ